MKLTIVKQFDNTFKVAYDSDYEKLKRIKPMQPVECEIRKPRNYQFHKKFFALLNVVYQNQEHYNNIEHLRYDLTIEAGYYKIRKTMQGDDFKQPKSISFAKMTEEEFNDYYSKVLDCIVKYFNFNKELIINNVQQYF